MKLEFTEEDRDRVFQEEKARHEAQERIKAEEKAKKATNARYGCGGCLGLIVLLGIIIALMPASKTTDPCHDLANMVDTQREQYLSRIDAIKMEAKAWPGGKDHLGPRARAYLRRFNNRMIPLMEERREFIFNNVYGNKNIDQGIHGCSGQELYSLRAASEQEMLSLRGFIDAMKLEIAGTH